MKRLSAWWFADGTARLAEAGWTVTTPCRGSATGWVPGPPLWEPSPPGDLTSRRGSAPPRRRPLYRPTSPRPTIQPPTNDNTRSRKMARSRAVALLVRGFKRGSPPAAAVRYSAT
jgi:hypothetical protein